MSDENDKTEDGKTPANAPSQTGPRAPLSLKPRAAGSVSTGTVKQSFSHGRSKTVVVETKRRAGAVPGHQRPQGFDVSRPRADQGGASAPRSNAPRGGPAGGALSVEEQEARRRAIALATQAQAERERAAVAEKAAREAAQRDQAAAAEKAAEAARAEAAAAKAAAEAEAKKAAEAEAKKAEATPTAVAAKPATETAAAARPQPSSPAQPSNAAKDTPADKGKVEKKDVAEAAKPAADESKPELLTAARGGKGDDLELIWGVGPKLGKMLNEMGVWHYDQIAKWTPAELAWVDARLTGFKGRALRDDWIAQSKKLATGWRPESKLGDKPAE